MTDEEQQKSFEDLEARLSKARQASPSAKLKEAELKVDNTGVGQAFRIGVDMLAALLVGTFIGWYLDRWLGTKPWFLITFMFLGGGAGIRNVYRTAMLMVKDVENEAANATEMDQNKASTLDSSHKDTEK
ncbi:MAG: AtpZ/AtpI family protein [Magnetovibrio sp.]|nr:AtpZ/AtpI family protein [Magnetovibrio sp.]